MTNEDTNKKKANEVEVEEVAIDMEVEEGMEKFVCPECKNEAIIPTGGCGICLQCGYSKCS